MDWAQTLLSGAIGAIVGSLAAAIYTNSFSRIQEIRRVKLDTLRKLAATRYMLTSGYGDRPDAFLQALNEASIVFQDSPKVLGVLEELHSDVLGGRVNDPILEQHLLKLFQAMFDNLGIDHGNLRDSYITKPFTRRI